MTNYAQGGYIGPEPDRTDSVPILLARGCVAMSYASYRAMGPAVAAELFRHSDIELFFTAEDIKRLQQELEDDDDVPD